MKTEQVSWVKQISQLPQSPPMLIQAWLAKSYVVSQAFRQRCHQLSVQLIAQRFTHPFVDEKNRLLVTEDKVWVREIFLQGDGVPWSYGRVVIPQATYCLHEKHFATLGTQPIGEKLLYHNPHVKRDYFEYALFSPLHALSKHIYQQLPDVFPRAQVWGRRSVFFIENAPLLVAEFFLPTVPSYPE